MWTSSSSSSAISSTSLSSSTSSSTPSHSPSAAANPRLPKSMEEVWKDITLASSDLHRHSSPRGVILQDFFSTDPPPNSASSHGFSASPLPPPPTMFNLNSSPADHFGRLLYQPPLQHHHHQIPPHVSHVSSVASTFDAVVPDDNGCGANNKRFPGINRSSGDRRHKRMIKNRESAARSRARKQAYTNELELEVAHLLEENARLRKEQEQFFREAAVAQNQKRNTLDRTSSAPF